MSLHTELRTRIEQQYILYIELTKFSVTSLDTYKKWLAKWRLFISEATQIQLLCKKEIRKPHTITEVKTTWGSYKISEASNYQSLVARNSNIITNGILLRLAHKMNIKNIVSIV